MATVENKQCQRCVHKDVCKYIDTIAKIKEEYPFVQGVTCGFCIRKTTENSKPETETDALETKTPAKQPEKQEPKPAPKEQAKLAQKVDKTDSKMTMRDISLRKLGISDPDILKATDGAGIENLGQLYDAIDDPDSPLKLNKNNISSINNVLSALNQKTIDFIPKHVLK